MYVKAIKKFFSKIVEIIGFEEILIFGGVSLVSYGFYSFIRWLGFVVCGILCLSIGFFLASLKSGIKPRKK